MEDLEHLHFIGIAGSFMVGAARLAAERGHQISGSDTAFYPPMGEQAHAIGATLYTDYNADVNSRPADCYIIGNAVSRGNPLVESILSSNLPYISAPQWFAENILRGKTTIAVAGTHGKTTTASLLAWLMESAGLSPGFLLGGVHPNFGVSAKTGSGQYFVIEADEYDSAFFDKRPKFLHYRPTVAVLNNLEFDHADIYDSLAGIIKQFHYLLRTLPANGQAIVRFGDKNLAQALHQGVYSQVATFGGGSDDGGGDWLWGFVDGEMVINKDSAECCRLSPPLSGKMNRDNILAAIVAANAVGVDATRAGEFLAGYHPPLRRLQKIIDSKNILVFDDFAHHPTAYRQTIAALAEMHPTRRIIVAFEPRSNTMKAGFFKNELAMAFAAAARVIACSGDIGWDLALALKPLADVAAIENTVDDVVARIVNEVRPGDCVLLMSNGDFGGLAEKLKQRLE